MSCLTILLSPFNLLLFVIVAGLSIGRIRINGISVGIAGILFAAIFVGFLMNKLIPNESREIIVNAQSTLKTFSKLGTALFVSVIVCKQDSPSKIIQKARCWHLSLER